MFFKGFFSFLDLCVQIRSDAKFRPMQEEHLYTILSATSFSVNYNKTHKSWLKHEIKHDLYKICPKKKTNLKTKILDFWVFLGFFLKT